MVMRDDIPDEVDHRLFAAKPALTFDYLYNDPRTVALTDGDVTARRTFCAVASACSRKGKVFGAALLVKAEGFLLGWARRAEALAGRPLGEDEINREFVDGAEVLCDDFPDAEEGVAQ